MPHAQVLSLQYFHTPRKDLPNFPDTVPYLVSSLKIKDLFPHLWVPWKVVSHPLHLFHTLWLWSVPYPAAYYRQLPPTYILCWSIPRQVQALFSSILLYSHSFLLHGKYKSTDLHSYQVHPLQPKATCHPEVHRLSAPFRCSFLYLPMQRLKLLFHFPHATAYWHIKARYDQTAGHAYPHSPPCLPTDRLFFSRSDHKQTFRFPKV